MSAVSPVLAELREHKKRCVRCRSKQRCPEARRLAKDFIRVARKAVGR